MKQRAAVAYELHFGREDERTIDAIAALIPTLMKLSELEEARMLSQRVLKYRQKDLASVHRSALLTVDQLVIILWQQGKSAEVVELCERLLSTLENFSAREPPPSVGIDNADWVMGELEVPICSEEMEEMLLYLFQYKKGGS